MKLILRDYIRNLKERDELEVVMINLLSAIGLTVLSEPRRGTTQKGVDILAVGRMPSDEQDVVYLLTIKEGNINRAKWGGEQGVRESIQQICDAYIPSRLEPRFRALPKKVVLCFGGDFVENLRDDWCGFNATMNSVIAQHSASILSWDGDEIAKLIAENLMSPQLLVTGKRQWLVKALAMVDEPTVATQCFNRYLLAYNVQDAKEIGNRMHMDLSQIALALDMMRTHCANADNFDAAYQAAEMTLLFAWNYTRGHKGNYQTKIKNLYEGIWREYLEIAELYVTRIERLTGEKYLFAMGCKANTEVDVNLSLFDVLGRLASLGSGLLYYVHDEKEDDEAAVRLEHLATRVLKCALRLIDENPTACSPLRDDMSFELGMTCFFFVQMGRGDFVRNWIHSILVRQQTNFIFRRSYPAYGLSYSELLEHARAGGDKDHQDRVMGSSSFFAVLAMMTATLNQDEEFKLLARMKNRFFPNCDLQLWFPQNDSEAHFYTNDQPHGKALTSLCIEQKVEFLKRVCEECEYSKITLSVASSKYIGVLFVGCRRYRYPLPAHFWMEVRQCFGIKRCEKSGDSAATVAGQSKCNCRQVKCNGSS